MKEQFIAYKNPQAAEKFFAKHAWPGQKKSCGQCSYKDQDIDACPCAKCHTRN